MKIKKKIKPLKEITYNGFGFPVLILNAPTKQVRGKIEPIINYKSLGAAVIYALCHKETPLTGNQVRFLRLYFELSLRDFANLFGLSHPAVIKWENHKDAFAEISPATEKAIRLEALFRLGISAKAFHRSFHSFQNLADKLRKTEAKSEAPLKFAI